MISLALVCGLLFTTMPITIVGGAFAAAWEKKEVIEVALNVQVEMLYFERLTPTPTLTLTLIEVAPQRAGAAARAWARRAQRRGRCVPR